jgi:hypothetical protein
LKKPTKVAAVVQFDLASQDGELNISKHNSETGNWQSKDEAEEILPKETDGSTKGAGTFKELTDRLETVERLLSYRDKIQVKTDWFKFETNIREIIVTLL